MALLEKPIPSCQQWSFSLYFQDFEKDDDAMLQAALKASMEHT
jgi:hypothetical protein